jgi:hypothetical protein
MKKYLATFLIATCLGTLSWAQGTKSELFDTKKSQDELYVMKAVLASTLAIAAQNLERRAATAAAQAQASPTTQVQTPFGPLTASRASGYALASPWGYANIDAFYLYGQGAVFMIPASALRLSRYTSTAAGTGGGGGRGSGRGTGEGVAGGVVGGVLGGTRGGTVGGVPAGVPATPPQPAAVPKPAAPPAPPPPPPPPQVTSTNSDEVQKMLAAQLKAYEEQIRKYQEAIQKDRAALDTFRQALEKSSQTNLAQFQQQLESQSKDVEARRAQTIAALGEIKKDLIEALANYGDALTTVKPNEYISIVILLDESQGPTVISAQRSWITDYKAGRLTLDAFKQKVLQYSE